MTTQKAIMIKPSLNILLEIKQNFDLFSAVIMGLFYGQVVQAPINWPDKAANAFVTISTAAFLWAVRKYYPKLGDRIVSALTKRVKTLKPKRKKSIKK